MASWLSVDIPAGPTKMIGSDRTSDKLQERGSSFRVVRSRSNGGGINRREVQRIRQITREGNATCADNLAALCHADGRPARRNRAYDFRSVFAKHRLCMHGICDTKRSKYLFKKRPRCPAAVRIDISNLPRAQEKRSERLGRAKTRHCPA